MSSVRKTKNPNDDDDHDDVKQNEIINENDNADNDDDNHDSSSCCNDSSSSLLLQLALKTAGSKGIIKLGAVEVYKYRDEYGDLKLVDMWISDSTTKAKEAAGSSSAAAVEVSKSESLPTDSVPTVRPGTGLVGTLWSSMTRSKVKMSRSQASKNNVDLLEGGNNHHTMASNNNTTSGKIEEGVSTTAFKTSTSRRRFDDDDDEGQQTIFSSLRRGANRSKQQQQDQQGTGMLFWRDLTTIEIDPDTWTCSRLSKQIQSQLSKAAGLTFDIDGIKGLVVYYSQKNTQGKLLKSIHNTTYLKRCTTHIGSVVAILECHRSCMDYKKQLTKSITAASDRNVDDKQNDGSEDEEVAGGVVATSSAVGGGSASPSMIEDDDGGLTTETRSSCCRRVVGWYNKCWGAGLQIPPPMELQQVSWTLLGSFIGMLTLSLLSEMFSSLTDEEYFLVIGPFGAQMTLLYSLHAAPASQPRNVILGEVVAGAVSMAVSYLPMPKWLRRAVCPALGISAMTAAGVTHPPAGAHATIWADKNHNWNFYLIVVFCSAVSVIPATIVNNMSLKRQYPIYWGYLPKWLYRKIWKDDDKKKY